MISIIVPIYNCELYLRKCIDSLVKQSDMNIEIILVNDGSLDSSLQICREFEKKDQRIKIINKNNGGAASARNAGLDIATGDYISFIDGDDWIHEDFCLSMSMLASNNDADVVRCEYKRVANESDEIYERIKDPILEVLNNYQALKLLCIDFASQWCVVTNKLFRKYLFDHIRFQEGRGHEDEFIIHILLYSAKKVIQTNAEYYFYRNTNESTMNTKFNLKRFDLLIALEERSLFLKDKFHDLYLYTLIELCRFYIRHYKTVSRMTSRTKLTEYSYWIEMVQSNYLHYYTVISNNIDKSERRWMRRYYKIFSNHQTSSIVLKK